MVLLIIIPTKWLFHWGYTPFSDIPMWCHDDPFTEFQATQVLFVHNPFEDWRWVFIHFVLCTSHSLLGPHLIPWFVQENSNLKPNRGHSPNTKKGIHFPHCEAAGNEWPVEGWRCCLANAVWHFLYHHKLDTSSALGENSGILSMWPRAAIHFDPPPASPTSPTWVWVKIRYPNNWMVNTKLD